MYISRLLLLTALCLSDWAGGRVLGSELRSATKSFEDSLRRVVIAIAQAELGVEELSGRNDGPRVEQYLAYCELPSGYQWCAAFVSWCFGQAGLAEPRTPWSPSLFPLSRQVLKPQPGDILGLWIQSKNRIGHVGIVESADESWCISIEGNLQNAVLRMRRPVSTIYRFSDWFKGKEGEHE